MIFSTIFQVKYQISPIKISLAKNVILSTTYFSIEFFFTKLQKLIESTKCLKTYIPNLIIYQCSIVKGQFTCFSYTILSIIS